MILRTAAAGLFATALLLGTSKADAQTAPAQLNDHLLPVAAGALVGAAASFFVLPLIVPATAVVATAGASTTAGPVLAAVGAGIGGIVGYEMVR